MYKSENFIRNLRPLASVGSWLVSLTTNSQTTGYRGSMVSAPAWPRNLRLLVHIALAYV